MHRKFDSDLRNQIRSDLRKDDFLYHFSDLSINTKPKITRLLVVHYNTFRFFFQIIDNEFNISFFCDIFINIDIEIVILFRGFRRTRLNMFQIDTSSLDEKMLLDLSRLSLQGSEFLDLTVQTIFHRTVFKLKTSDLAYVQFVLSNFYKFV